MKENLCLLNLCIKEKRKGRRLLFVLYQVLNVKLFKKGTGESVEETFVKWGRLAFVFEKPVDSLKYEEIVASEEL